MCYATCRRRVAMKNFLAALGVVALTFTVSSCLELDRGGCSESRIKVQGSGHVVTEERPVEDITGVNLATMGTMYIEIGNEDKLVIEGEDNLIEYIETRVRGRVLTVQTRRNTNLRCRKPIKYHLTVRDLSSISISSSGDIVAPDFDAERFKISVSSSGDLEMGDLKAELLRASISSSGDVQIDDLHAYAADISISSSGDLSIDGGRVEEQDVKVSSSGDYHASDLESVRATVRLSSSGDAHIYVTDDLDVVISSSGSVYYAGNPSLQQTISSSGRARRIGI
jgi:hypothetical protein